MKEFCLTGGVLSQDHQSVKRRINVAGYAYKELAQIFLVPDAFDLWYCCYGHTPCDELSTLTVCHNTEHYSEIRSFYGDGFYDYTYFWDCQIVKPDEPKPAW